MKRGTVRGTDRGLSPPRGLYLRSDRLSSMLLSYPTSRMNDVVQVWKRLRAQAHSRHESEAAKSWTQAQATALTPPGGKLAPRSHPKATKVTSFRWYSRWNSESDRGGAPKTGRRPASGRSSRTVARTSTHATACHGTRANTRTVDRYGTGKVTAQRLRSRRWGPGGPRACMVSCRLRDGLLRRGRD